MIRKPKIEQDNGGYIYFDIYRDNSMCLSAIVWPVNKNGYVDINVYADLEDLTAAEMRDLWRELSLSYISPPEIMAQIRANVITHLYHADRVDLVAVCLDNAPHMEDKKRL